MPRHPLVLLSGLLCDAELWSATAPALADLATCHTPDLTQDSSLDAMAARVLATAPPRFALAGLSMGGYLALTIAASAPERLTGLCLIATSAAPDTPAQGRRRRGLIGLVARNPRFLGVTQRLLPDLLHPRNVTDATLAATIQRMSLRVGRHGYLRQQAAILARPDRRPGLPHITVPALILIGEADTVTPLSAAEQMRALIPRASLRVIPASGHLPPLENPAAVAEAMRDWLNSIEPDKSA